MSTLGRVPDANLLTWASAQQRSGAFDVIPSITTEGVPTVAWYQGYLEVNSAGRRMTITDSSAQRQTWTNITSSNQWTGWKPQALATKPQEFDLPRASGWNNYSGMRSRHWKNQFDEVSVVVDISNDNTVSHGAVVATLPEGFRPAAAFNAPAIIYDGSEILPVRAYFSTNGQISISGYSNQTWSKVLFFETQASFIAAS